MSSQQWEKCQESKLYRFSWVSDNTVIEVHLKTTVVDMAVRVLAEEKGSDLMLWGGAFFLFLYFCYSFFASIFYFLFIYSYYSLAKQFSVLIAYKESFFFFFKNCILGVFILCN